MPVQAVLFYSYAHVFNVLFYISIDFHRLKGVLYFQALMPLQRLSLAFV